MMTNNRDGLPGALSRLLAPLRQYIAELDAASRESMQRDVEMRELARAERREREAELRDEAELFTARLPTWLRHDTGGPGSRWVAAADIVLRRRRGRPPFAVHVGRSRPGLTLLRGSQLRLVERHVPVGLAAAPSADAAADPQRAVLRERRTFEVLEGPLAGVLIDVAARPANGLRREALTAAAMVAPVGERIAEVPDAAHSVLRQLEECRRQADHAEAVLRHRRHWAWAHSPTRPRQAEVRVETVDRRATGGEDRPPRT